MFYRREKSLGPSGIGIADCPARSLGDVETTLSLLHSIVVICTNPFISYAFYHCKTDRKI